LWERRALGPIPYGFRGCLLAFCGEAIKEDDYKTPGSPEISFPKYGLNIKILKISFLFVF
jgi:hypothetical protein